MEQELAVSYSSMITGKKTRNIVLLVIIALLTFMTVHDLLPYRERNRVTQVGTLTELYDFEISNSSVIINIGPLYEIQRPGYFVLNTTIHSLYSNISLHIILSNSSLIPVRMPILGYYEFLNDSIYHFDISQSYANLIDGGFEPQLRFFNFNITTHCILSVNIDYEIELMFLRPPKVFIWKSVFDFLGQEGVIFASVILMAIVLVYAGCWLIKN